MTPDQLTRTDIAGMTPEEVVEAHDAGRFDVALGASPADAQLKQRARSGEPVTRADIRRLSELGEHQLIADIPIDRIQETR